MSTIAKISLTWRMTVPYHKFRAFRSDVRTSYDIDPLQLVYVDPDSIRHHSPTLFDRWEHIGEIRDGDWDRVPKGEYSWLGTPIDDHNLYIAMVSRFIDGRPWTETGYVNQQLEKVEREESAWFGKCHSREEVFERCDFLDRLYADITHSGFDEDTYTSVSDWFKFDPYHSITINIGRDGELLFAGDGRHRLFISKIADIDEIPVRVLVVHDTHIANSNDPDSMENIVHA